MNKDDVLKKLPITTRENKEPYVFISYKSDDRKEVFDNYVIPLVEEYGLKVYADKSFDDYNDYWTVQMERNLTSDYCKAVLVFVSERYVGSYATLLEVLYAINNDKQIIPICLCDNIYEIRDKVRDEWQNVRMTPKESSQLLSQFDSLKYKYEGKHTKKDIVSLALSQYCNIESGLRNETLEKGKLAVAFLEILLKGEFNYKKQSIPFEHIVNTIRNIDGGVFGEIHRVSKNEGTINNENLTVSNTSGNSITGGLCQIDWLNWKGKLPEVKDYSFVIEYKNTKCQNCKNWVSVWRELLELLGQDGEMKNKILQLCNSEVIDNKHSLKTFFGGQRNLKKNTQFTRSYHVESIGIDVENYWNKENMCKEIMKLCKALGLNETEIVIKGIPLE